MNPQWQKGNVVSHLGLLPWVRKANEELVGSFREVSRHAGWAQDGMRGEGGLLLRPLVSCLAGGLQCTAMWQGGLAPAVGALRVWLRHVAGHKGRWTLHATARLPATDMHGSLAPGCPPVQTYTLRQLRQDQQLPPGKQ